VPLARKSDKGRVVTSGDTLSKKLLLSYIFILALSMSLIPFTIDPYLPAFPEIAGFYGVPNGTVQASMTGVTIGLALGQLVLGPLSDAFGRRPLLLITITGYGLSAVLVFFVQSFETFLLLRFAMGFFAAGADVISRAIVRDLYRGQPMQQMLARIFLIQSLAPIVGPIVGSQLTEVMIWQGVFLVFGFIGIALALLASRLLIETLPKSARRSSTPAGLARGYRSVLNDRIYIGLMFYGAFQLAALFAYLNTVPFIFQEGFGLSPSEFGVWIAVNAAASYIGVQVGSRLARVVRGQWLLAWYSGLGILVGVGLMLTAGGSIWWAELFFFIQLFLFGAGITTIPTIALYNHGKEAGTAASLLGVFNFSLTSLVSVVYALLRTDTTYDVGGIIALLFFISLSSLIFITRPWKVPDLRRG
jgi:MFS transporter, DHA1 family, multidrug resistance protein